MRINDYAMIGDGRSAALVSAAGAIDWLCWPRFDSPPLFGALLDPDGGSWRLAPIGEAQITRRYLDDSNVLETRFATATGTVAITDLMTAVSEEEMTCWLRVIDPASVTEARWLVQFRRRWTRRDGALYPVPGNEVPA